ncbi:MAG: hypothetical protein WCO28_09830, partial [Bacteroidota bacterium]
MFTGNENQQISLTAASALTANYRSNQIGIGFILGQYFSKDSLNSVLNQETCVGVRIYYGLNADNTTPELVVVGVDANENDLANGIVLDNGALCPPRCGLTNSLNS